ncbi:MerR family DNA-binding transcriptional regulator [Sphingomonas sp.]|uniref:MerR family transcriptional regulator n=1 Tax=Sphingomonas sp. TaxID=28214 RepID=UPI000DAF8660|nr:MerR family DNA-binding transcriptional regulator [Sphingomonas sp.]PZU09512.1 MAG: MerR family transcriptional regulator [Sphingomonas sp.]
MPPDDIGPIPPGTPEKHKQLKGIQDAARELGVTLRTLRFYEKEGLIQPQRIGNIRIYSKRETVRMQLILRGKRLGFSIREVKDFLDLYDADPAHHEQTERLIDQVRKRLADLGAQRAALDMTIGELTAIEADCVSRLGQ